MRSEAKKPHAGDNGESSSRDERTDAAEWDGTFISTFDYPDSAVFRERSVVIPRVIPPAPKDEAKDFLAVIRAARTAKAMVLDCASGRIQPELLACCVIGLWRKRHRPVIVMAGAMWHKDPGLRGVIQKAVLRLADRAVARYAMQSTEEFPAFVRSWGIPERKLRFMHYYYTFTERDLRDVPPAAEDFVFAGGNTHRDYLPLIEAMKNLPEHRLVIGSKLLEGMELPANVEAGQLPREEFIRKMRSARAVVVPIRQGLTRSTGHQTYLNGMLLRKPTIVTDVLGVREYTEDGRAVMIVDGTPEGYEAAIRKVFSPGNQEEIERMCDLAQKLATEEYTFEDYADRLVQILDEAVLERTTGMFAR
ncbi:hypothetical protein MRU69_05735 [Kocuria flava]|uniref:hypothetical protein n=1 Tax=Kocuria flava TaxID=446860 RepID=UPI001FF247F9|nr:hypothetical protein [Kocuria flava]MCJ8504304.1 hypothetical protein [Kocuria flava]MCJ8504369.1 hypothetical protein [Kocuria flava]